jgi:hypothetical protein
MFHHADHWMKVLGMEVFSAWLMIYTWCDRQQYPQDDVSHHKDIREVAQAFSCGVNKAQKIIQTLYEFGLIEIVQKKNKYGGVKNVYYWYEIPVYADSTFCELKKFRNWSDRNWHGQELAKLRKIKEEKEVITSRIENEYGSKNLKNANFEDEPYPKSIRQPYSKQIHNNVLNNNYVVAVRHVEKCREDIQPEIDATKENKNSGETSIPMVEYSRNNKVHEIQTEVEKTCGVQISVDLLDNLANKYGVEKIKEKISLLGRVKTKNAPGFLISALKDDYQLLPGRPQQQETRKKPALQRHKKEKSGGDAAAKIVYNGRELSEQEFLEMHNTGQISEEDFLAHAPQKTFYKTLYMG